MVFDGGVCYVWSKSMNAQLVQKTYQSGGVAQVLLLGPVNPSRALAEKNAEGKTILGSESRFGDHFIKPVNPNALDRFWGLNE
jgi:hypothetical protein